MDYSKKSKISSEVPQPINHSDKDKAAMPMQIRNSSTKPLSAQSGIGLNSAKGPANAKGSSSTSVTCAVAKTKKEKEWQEIDGAAGTISKKVKLCDKPMSESVRKAFKLKVPKKENGNNSTRNPPTVGGPEINDLSSGSTEIIRPKGRVIMSGVVYNSFVTKPSPAELKQNNYAKRDRQSKKKKSRKARLAQGQDACLASGSECKDITKEEESKSQSADKSEFVGKERQKALVKEFKEKKYGEKRLVMLIVKTGPNHHKVLAMSNPPTPTDARNLSSTSEDESGIAQSAGLGAKANASTFNEEKCPSELDLSSSSTSSASDSSYSCTDSSSSPSSSTSDFEEALTR